MIIFRTDASTKSGFGRLVRIAGLASLLKSKTGVLVCLSSAGDKAVSRFLDEKKWSFCWLKQLKQHLSPAVRGIVFDLKYFSAEDMGLVQQARANHWTTIQLSDHGAGAQEVDFTIDASVDTLSAGPLGEADSLGEKVLGGPGYAILHHRFRHFHRIRRKYRKKIKKVFLCLGGSVEYRTLRKVIDLLSRFRWELKIAPGFYIKKSAQKTLRRIYPGIGFTGKCESLARSFFEADVALTGPGMSAYEAAAVGTPALYFCRHQQEKSMARAFAEKGTGLEIAGIDDLSPQYLADQFNALTFEKRMDMGGKAKQLVDGGGVYRVLEFFERLHLTG